MKSIQRLVPACVMAGLAACSVLPHSASSPTASSSSAGSSNDVARAPQTVNDVGVAYAKLVLALGEHDADYVDAFYGPANWREEAKRRALSPKQIEAEATALLEAVDRVTTTQVVPDPELPGLRKRYLKIQIAALVTRAQMLQGRKLSFDEEARLLYDTEAPHYKDAQFAPVLKRIEKLLPKDSKHRGDSLAERYNRYLDRFSVPKDRIETVMQAAIGEARQRAYAHLPLPLGERFELSLVQGKPWSAYNWYQGKFVSRIEVNTMLPIPVSRIIDLAAHEGYPGHHVYNGLLENGLVNDLGWGEYQAYALFSPQSLIAEGTADFGVGLAFPGSDKLALTKKLFKLSGLDPKQAATYLKIIKAARELAPAGIEAARRYLDGDVTAEQTSVWLQKFTLSSPERAKQRLAFFDKYRAYVINYTWGEELVRRYVEKQGDKKAGSDKQWTAFFALVSTPRTPSGIAPGAAAQGEDESDADNVAAFDFFVSRHPTEAEFHGRYPAVTLVLPGAVATREFRSDRSRYFAEIDGKGRITGGRFM